MANRNTINMNNSVTTSDLHNSTITNLPSTGANNHANNQIINITPIPTIVRKNEIYGPATFKKMNGSLSIRNKVLEWRAAPEHKNVPSLSVPFDFIINHFKSENTKNNRPLLKVKTKENMDGLIFSFNSII